MEYLFYCTHCGFNKNEEPISLFTIEKSAGQPHPKTIFCLKCQHETPIKRYLGANPHRVVIH